MAVFLLYMEAAFQVLTFLIVGLGSLFTPFGALLGLITVGLVWSGYGIANERRSGYVLAVALAGLTLAWASWWVVREGLGLLFDLNFLISIMIPVALFCLLVHPQSREYQRIWFS